AYWTAALKLPKRRRIVFSDGLMPAWVTASSAWSEARLPFKPNRRRRPPNSKVFELCMAGSTNCWSISRFGPKWSCPRASLRHSGPSGRASRSSAQRVQGCQHHVRYPMGDRLTYVRPSWFERHIMAAIPPAARLMSRLTGDAVLQVRGRRSGQMRTTLARTITVGESRYLVAIRGETQWARNLRAVGQARLWEDGRSAEHALRQK